MTVIPQYSKYKNIPTELDGIKFDSQKEAKRYRELTLLMRAGEVKEVIPHPQFELIPSFRKNGKTWRATIYEADFKVVYADGHTEIEDVKGKVLTKDFRIKQKLFEYKYPDMTIRIV